MTLVSTSLVNGRRYLLTSQVTGNMITLCAFGIASFPPACQAKVVGRLTTYMVVAEVYVKVFRVVVCA